MDPGASLVDLDIFVNPAASRRGKDGSIDGRPGRLAAAFAQNLWPLSARVREGSTSAAQRRARWSRRPPEVAAGPASLGQACAHQSVPQPGQALTPRRRQGALREDDPSYRRQGRRPPPALHRAGWRREEGREQGRTLRTRRVPLGPRPSEEPRPWGEAPGSASSSHPRIAAGARSDQADYVRRYMAQVEHDVGFGALDWAAVNHYNTEHPHVHVIIRGVDLVTGGRGPVRARVHLERHAASRTGSWQPWQPGHAPNSRSGGHAAGRSTRSATRPSTGSFERRAAERRHRGRVRSEPAAARRAASTTRRSSPACSTWRTMA